MPSVLASMLLKRDLGESHHRSTILECFSMISYKKISSFFNTLPLSKFPSLPDDPAVDL